MKTFEQWLQDKQRQEQQYDENWKKLAQRTALGGAALLGGLGGDNNANAADSNQFSSPPAAATSSKFSGYPQSSEFRRGEKNKGFFDSPPVDWAGKMTPEIADWIKKSNYQPWVNGMPQETEVRRALLDGTPPKSWTDRSPEAQMKNIDNLLKPDDEDYEAEFNAKYPKYPKIEPSRRQTDTDLDVIDNLFNR